VAFILYIILLMFKRPRQISFFVTHFILSLNLFSMERPEVNNLGQLFNRLFSCQERSLRFEHHIALITHYQARRTIPKGFELKFHSGFFDSKTPISFYPARENVNSIPILEKQSPTFHSCSKIPILQR
jgi:hypothetical protein